MIPRADACRPGRYAFVAMVIAVGLCGCASHGPAALILGDTRGAAEALLGKPTAEFMTADGGHRLEYAGGTFARRTYMLDFDAAQRLLRWENVLDEAHFQAIHPGLTQRELRERLGPPARVWSVHYRNQTVWSYRFETPFCQVFHVGLTPAGRVEDTSYGPDPLCDGEDLRKRRR